MLRNIFSLKYNILDACIASFCVQINNNSEQSQFQYLESQAC